MPTYEYARLSCDDRFERMVREARVGPRYPKGESSGVERLVPAAGGQSNSICASAMTITGARDAWQCEKPPRA